MREDLLAGRLTQEQIAEKHGISRRSVRRAADAVAEATKDVVEQGYEAIRALVPRAIETLEAHLDNPDGRIAVQAANSLLDRSGLVKSERREYTGPGGTELVIRLTAGEDEAAARGRPPLLPEGE